MFSIEVVSLSTSNEASPWLCAFLSCSVAIWRERAMVQQKYIKMLESDTGDQRMGMEENDRNIGSVGWWWWEPQKTQRAKMTLGTWGRVFAGVVDDPEQVWYVFLLRVFSSFYFSKVAKWNHDSFQGSNWVMVMAVTNTKRLESPHTFLHICPFTLYHHFWEEQSTYPQAHSQVTFKIIPKSIPGKDINQIQIKYIIMLLCLASEGMCFNTCDINSHMTLLKVTSLLTFLTGY